MGELMNRSTLDGKTALITGAASGIGKAIAQSFAQEGVSVALLDVNSRDGTEVANTILSSRGQALFCCADVAIKRDCVLAVHETIERFGGLDILINSAGIIHRATILETSEEEWDRGMAVNVKSIFLLSSEVIPIMERRKGGVIINIASGWGLVGGAKAALYCASKGAVVQLTRAMALDHGPQNIRVNCICPGDTDTPMLTSEASQLGLSLESIHQEARGRPLRRLGMPDDIANAALFLADDASSNITGTTLVVDGGGLAG
jgi:NAD(P)-dependent dehydrogenase (short-subunit alcohol dehydrogenase family)